MLSKILLVYWLGINLLALLLMYWDKQKAQKQAWRIAEKTFFTLAAAGGSLGIFFAMPLLRHKNRKMSFKLPIYAIIMAQVGILLLLANLRLL